MMVVNQSIPIEEQLAELNSIIYDLRAEVIVANLNDIENISEQLIIDRRGQFRRTHRNDILGFKVTDYNLDDNDFLQIDLSRDGIYDYLPEFFFHGPKEDKGISINKMVANYQNKQAEEKSARLFFQPFENEIFLSSLGIEIIEKELFFELNSSKSSDFIYDFWQIDEKCVKDLNKIYPEIIPKFIKMLPFIHKVIGNFQLTCNCLSFLINEKVSFKKKSNNVEEKSDFFSILGDCFLGVDSVAGQSFEDFPIELKFIVGPLENTSFYDYIHQGVLKRFINLFFDYFIPIEVDVSFDYLMPDNTQYFELTDDCLLGITTKI